MKLAYKLLLTSALVAGVGAFTATDARADYYASNPKVVKQTHQTFVAVGTRKVGIVGSRPYPIEAARIESSTVRTTRAGTTAHTEVTTSTTTTPTPINFESSGGVYYTDERGARYYADPALNVVVRPTGSFNN